MTADLERGIGRTRDLLADCDDTNRVARLLDLADAYEVYAADGSDRAAADRLTGVVVRMVADADLVASGRLSRRRFTDGPLEAALGPVVDRMAGEPELARRAAMLREMWDLLDDEDVAEAVACLPYGGLVGGVDEMYWPQSFPKLVRNVCRRWREAPR